MLINASEKFKPLKKSKGSKRKEVDAASRLDIVATLEACQNNDYARVFDKEYFYFNKQAIVLTNVDVQGQSFEAQLPMKEDKYGAMIRVKSLELTPIKISQGDIELTKFCITKYDTSQYASLDNYCAEAIKPLVAQFDYKEQPLVVSTTDARYCYDADQKTLIKETFTKEAGKK